MNTFKTKEFEYKIHDNTVELIEYLDKAAEEVIIPEIIDSYRVESIEKECFEYCSQLKKVTIPDSIKYIGEAAFYGCSSLIRITIPEMTICICDEAFAHCASLQEVNIKGYTIFSNRVFYYCKNIEKLTIGDKVFNNVTIDYGTNERIMITVEDVSKAFNLATIIANKSFSAYFYGYPYLQIDQSPLLEYNKNSSW